jgi:prepilin-type processing-associated H-X9-DG protein
MTDMSEANDPPPLDYANLGLRRRRRWWVWLIVLIPIVLLVISFLLPSQQGMGRGAPKVKCAANLRQIGQAILLYANDNHGQYPDSFGTLLLNEDITSDAFVCPDSNDTPATGATTQAIVANLTAGGHLSYIYLGNGMNTATVAANAVVAYEPLSNHANTGMNVLFGDGHVEFIFANTPAAVSMASQLGAKKFPVTMPVQ